MIWRLLRGVCSVTAAMTGLLLVYGFVFAMEGMTTRVPMTALHELVTVTLWMLPWMMLYCSGLEDLVTVTRRATVFWLGIAPVLAFPLLQRAPYGRQRRHKECYAPLGDTRWIAAARCSTPKVSVHSFLAPRRNCWCRHAVFFNEHSCFR